jgi:hypothetical protein
MELTWGMSWGHGNQYPNASEVIGCYDQGVKALLTVGKVDNMEVYNLATLESIGLKDREDEELYQIIAAIANKFEGSNAAKASFLFIPQLVELYPNAYYQIANEPDHVCIL